MGKKTKHYASVINCTILDYDERIQKIQSGEKYVADGIGEQYIQWIPNYGEPRIPVMISAQTGTGKNTFIEEKLIPLAKQCDIQMLIVSNRIANSRQQKERIARKVGCDEILEMLTAKGLDAHEDFKFIKIVTYHKLGVYLSDVLKKRDLGKYEIVIFDECHFFTSDALFNSKTDKILSGSLEAFKDSLRIYMTATPDEIFPIIAERELERISLPKYTYYAYNPFVYIISPASIIYYEFKRNYNYIYSHYFNSKNELIELIKKDQSDSKWLIFVNSKKDGEFFAEQIGEKAIFVSSESKESKNSDGAALVELISGERFSSKVLIATSVLDNGINIKDKLLKNIVIFTYDKTEFIQMIGRKRIENDDNKLNLYICAKSSGEFTRQLNLVNQKIQAICTYKKNREAFINKYYNGTADDKMVINGMFYLDNNSDIHQNTLAHTKVFDNKIFLEKIIKRFDEGDKNAFIFEQLLWLGLEKTYDEERWVSYVPSDNYKAEFLNFLNENYGEDISGERLEEFKRNFKCLYNNAYGARKSDRPDRTYGETVMRDLIEKHNLNYEIEVKKDGTKKTLKLIRK